MLFTAAASIAFAAAATAASIPPPIESKPFELVLSSANKKFNGKKVSACHSGAAIESLCIGDAGVNFNFNTTTTAQTPIKGYTKSGSLVYDLPAEPKIPSSVGFYIALSTNYLIPHLSPGSETAAGFVFNKKDGGLKLTGYIDDTVTPPAAVDPYVLDNWFVCKTNDVGYQYTDLVWVPGNGSQKPQNPSCVKVTVKRVFV